MSFEYFKKQEYNGFEFKVKNDIKGIIKGEKGIPESY